MERTKLHGVAWVIILDTPCAAGARSTSFPPVVPPEEVYLKQRFYLIRSRTSVQRPLIWCPNSHLVRSIISMLRFWKFSSKSRKIRVRKRSLNRLIVLVSFIKESYRYSGVYSRFWTKIGSGSESQTSIPAYFPGDWE